MLRTREWLPAADAQNRSETHTAHPQGRALDDDQLEAALQEMDADGNGTIDYDELEAFILGNEQQDSESISGALQFALRRKLLAVQAKDLMNRLGLATKKTSKGHVHIKSSFTTGSTFPVPSSSAKGMHSDHGGAAVESKHGDEVAAAAAPFKLHLQVGAEGELASVADLGAEEGETEAVQLVLGVGADVDEGSIATVQRVVDELLSKGRDIMAMMDEPMPVTRVQLAGPMPSPVAGTTGNVVVLTVYLSMNLAAMLAENLELDDLIDDDLLDSDDEAGSASSSDDDAKSESDFEGRKIKKTHVHDVIKGILRKLEITLQANHSLADMLAGSRCDDGGSFDVQAVLDVKVSKAMLQLLRTVIELGAYKGSVYGDRRKSARSVIATALMAGVNKLESHLHFDSARMLEMTAAAGLSEDRPAMADVTPARLLAVMLEGFVFQGMLEDLDLDEEPGAGMDILAKILTGEGGATAPPAELLSQLTSTDAEDEEDIQGAMMGAGFGMFKWFSDSILDIRSVRAAGAGLGLHLQTVGLDSAAFTQSLVTVHTTRKLLVAQSAKQRAIPGLLVLPPSVTYSAAVRGTTTEKADSSWGAPEHHMSSLEIPNFSKQFQMTLRGVGAVDHCDVFEYSREEDSGELVSAFVEGTEAFHAAAKQTLRKPKVLPPSGVRGPFGAMLILPGAAFAPGVIGCGTAADADTTAGHADVATAKMYVAAVQERVAELNAKYPQQPSQAYWTVVVDCQGSKVHDTPGLTAAVQAAVGVSDAQVLVADFGSSLGVVSALSTAVQPVLKACATDEYIALRASDDLELPEED